MTTRWITPSARLFVTVLHEKRTAFVGTPPGFQRSDLMLAPMLPLEKLLLVIRMSLVASED